LQDLQHLPVGIQADRKLACRGEAEQHPAPAASQLENGPALPVREGRPVRNIL
jgi:hypothetical protein